MTPADHQALVDRLKRGLAARPEVLEAYLFGSRAGGGAQPHSDVDVAVFVDLRRLEDSGFGYAAELAAEVGRLLETDDVDVVLLNRAAPLLYHRVLRDGLRLFARDAKATTTREGRALSRYCDYVPHLRKIDAAYRARIESGDFGR
jgi:hypothetical protein